MPTILTKRSNTPGAIPATANLTNASGGAELAVNTADKRLFTITSASQVVELGTNPTNLTCGTASVTKLTASLNSEFTSTGALLISKGTTGEQPSPSVTGMLRYNTTTNQFEGYSGSSPAWKSVGGAAVSNDTSTASDLYPAFLSQTTGTAENVYTSNAKLLYKPSTGELKAAAPIASNGIILNSTTVASNYTIASGTNGFSVGPITINSSVTVTIASGQRHVVI